MEAMSAAVENCKAKIVNQVIETSENRGIHV